MEQLLVSPATLSSFEGSLADYPLVIYRIFYSDTRLSIQYAMLDGSACTHK